MRPSVKPPTGPSGGSDAIAAQFNPGGYTPSAPEPAMAYCHGDHWSLSPEHRNSYGLIVCNRILTQHDIQSIVRDIIWEFEQEREGI